MTPLFDAFISYGRADSKAFATKLQARLNEQGFKVWFDFNNIPLGVDYQNQIDDGIEKSHNFLFIIAPHSVNSDYCRKEIELAIRCNKRIIPLLHVEQISQETWQQRNPKETDEGWEVYQAKGLHSSFPNMHPLISKINWVYFREGIEDFEQSCAGLIELLHRHSDYVEQHTQLLAKALAWERHQKQTSYLLVGEEKHQAQSWLNIRFKDEQPPCFPTDLHCEYITESVKNGNNLMTQVFLAYADKDRATMEKIRNSLRRESITVWTNTTDIKTGEAFEEAIERGIEQADNIVYLLSPDAVNSTYCQRELDLALSLKKRIIPVLVRETFLDQVPSALRNLQYISLTDNVQEDDYRLDESKLLNILHEDAAYYNEQKILLTKALKWKRQNRNPSILLRGYNLRSAETWLKVAHKRTQHSPTPLQEEFIAESLQQPPLESLDVFISYSRADSDFARKLNDELQLQGKMTWFDQESIASGSDFQQEIYRGIKACDNFLFILSPRSVNSPYCQGEVDYAASLNKRFVTVLHQQVNTAKFHPELAKVQWIDFNQNQRDFNANFNQLVRTLDIDREHIRSHSKWLNRAIEWQEKDESADLLLRGSEFAVAENWLQETETHRKKPAATSLQKEFIIESGNAIAATEEAEKQRQAELLHLQEERTKEAEARLAEQKRSAKRQKRYLSIVSVALLVAVGVSFWAKREENRAEKNLAAQVDALSRYAKTLVNSEQNFEALIEGTRAGEKLISSSNNRFGRQGKKGEEREELKKTLREAFYALQELKRLGGQKTSVVKWSPDNKMVATADQNGKVTLWNFKDIKSKTTPMTIQHGKDVVDIFFSPGDGKVMATLDKDKTVKLWKQGENEFKFILKEEEVSDVKLSPNGKLIATFSEEGDNLTGKLWKIEGQSLKELSLAGKFDNVIFSADGKVIAVENGEKSTNINFLQFNGFDELKAFNFLPSSEQPDAVYFLSEAIILTLNFDKKVVKLWNLDGKELQLLSGEELWKYFFEENYKILAISSNHKMVATFDNNDRVVKLWRSDGKAPQDLKHDAKIVRTWFSPNNSIVVTASEDTIVKLWNQNGENIATLPNHSKPVYDVTFSSDSQTIATASYDKTVRLWDIEGNELQTLHPSTAVDDFHFSSDGETIATWSEDKTVQFWKVDSNNRTFLKHEAPVNRISFSADGKLMATTGENSDNQRAKLWHEEGKQPKPLLPNEQFDRLEFSPDGKLMALVSKNGGQTIIKLWKRDGDTNPVRFLTLDNELVDVKFSPDGKLIAIFSGKEVKLWSLEGKQSRRLLPNEQFEGFDGVEFNSDGKLMAFFSHNENETAIELWKREGMKLVRYLSHNLKNERFNEIKFSPDGKLIVIYDSLSWTNQSSKLWSLEDKQLQPLSFNEQFEEVEFSPDGKLMATLHHKEVIVKLWKLNEEGKPMPKPLWSESVRAHTVAFSSDGKLIATANDSNIVRLWNQNHENLATLNLKDSINALRFSPDNTKLAIASAGKQVILWHYLEQVAWEEVSTQELEELVKGACSKVKEYIKEWRIDRGLCDQKQPNLLQRSWSRNRNH